MFGILEHTFLFYIHNINNNYDNFKNHKEVGKEMIVTP